LRNKIIFFAISTILFASVQSAAAEISIYEKNEFSLEYPSEWKIKEVWGAYLKQVYFQVDIQSDSGVTIKQQKSISPISTINEELIQFMIDNEKENCRMNVDGPCWDYTFSSARSIIIDNTKAVLIEYQANLDNRERLVKKIFIPDGNNNWVIESKVSKDKTELFEIIGVTLESFTRNIEIQNEIQNEIQISSITDAGIPEWVKNTMKWYVEGTVSEKEMITVLEFLIDQKIIKINFAQ
jgi:hypothetical protein